MYTSKYHIDGAERNKLWNISWKLYHSQYSTVARKVNQVRFAVIDWQPECCLEVRTRPAYRGIRVGLYATATTYISMEEHFVNDSIAQQQSRHGFNLRIIYYTTCQFSTNSNGVVFQGTYPLLLHTLIFGNSSCCSHLYHCVLLPRYFIGQHCWLWVLMEDPSTSWSVKWKVISSLPQLSRPTHIADNVWSDSSLLCLTI